MRVRGSWNEEACVQRSCEKGWSVGAEEGKKQIEGRERILTVEGKGDAVPGQEESE